MVLNSGKCHFMCLGKNAEYETFFYIETDMINCSEEKILGIIINSKLKFKSRIKNLCKRVSQKIRALSSLTSYLNNSEKT